MSVKVAVIGAGSRSFGPAVIADLLLSDGLCAEGVDLALMDIVAAHLPENEAFARSAMQKLGRKIGLEATASLEPALEGADFVITAFEVDRYLYWSEDFLIPRKYGFKQVYGENGGPGGIFHALRNIPPLMEVARAMEKLCPQAYLLNFSNPEHKLCEAVSRLSPIRAVGLCHGVFMGLHQISALLGLPADELDAEACGINHFTWFTSIRDRRTGADLYPRLREIERGERLLTRWHECALGRILLRTFGLWPSPATNHYGEYIRWAGEFMASDLNFFYDPREGEPWATGNIPEFVYSAEWARTDRPWGSSDPRGDPAAVASAPARDAAVTRSGEVEVDIIEAIALGRKRKIAAVNVANRGAIPNLPDDMVVEVPAWCDGRGVQAARMPSLPEPIAAMLRTQASIHRLTVEAYAERSKTKLLQAILLDPAVDSYRNAVLMMEEMLAVQKKLLPELV